MEVRKGGQRGAAAQRGARWASNARSKFAVRPMNYENPTQRKRKGPAKKAKAQALGNAIFYTALVGGGKNQI